MRRVAPLVDPHPACGVVPCGNGFRQVHSRLREIIQLNVDQGPPASVPTRLKLSLDVFKLNSAFKKSVRRYYSLSAELIVILSSFESHMDTVNTEL